MAKKPEPRNLQIGALDRGVLPRFEGMNVARTGRGGSVKILADLLQELEDTLNSGREPSTALLREIDNAVMSEGPSELASGVKSIRTGEKASLENEKLLRNEIFQEYKKRLKRGGTSYQLGAMANEEMRQMFIDDLVEAGMSRKDALRAADDVYEQFVTTKGQAEAARKFEAGQTPEGKKRLKPVVKHITASDKKQGPKTTTPVGGGEGRRLPAPPSFYTTVERTTPPPITGPKVTRVSTNPFEVITDEALGGGGRFVDIDDPVGRQLARVMDIREGGTLRVVHGNEEFVVRPSRARPDRFEVLRLKSGTQKPLTKQQQGAFARGLAKKIGMSPGKVLNYIKSLPNPSIIGPIDPENLLGKGGILTGTRDPFKFNMAALAKDARVAQRVIEKEEVYNPKTGKTRPATAEDLRKRRAIIARYNQMRATLPDKPTVTRGGQPASMADVREARKAVGQFHPEMERLEGMKGTPATVTPRRRTDTASRSQFRRKVEEARAAKLKEQNKAAVEEARAEGKKSRRRKMGPVYRTKKARESGQEASRIARETRRLSTLPAGLKATPKNMPGLLLLALMLGAGGLGVGAASEA